MAEQNEALDQSSDTESLGTLKGQLGKSQLDSRNPLTKRDVMNKIDISDSDSNLGVGGARRRCKTSKRMTMKRAKKMSKKALSKWCKSKKHRKTKVCRKMCKSKK
jgi:hypothetical protein